MENKKYKLIIFDFDGTLADTSEGILNCHKHALVAMGRPEPADEELAGIIGGQLLKTYIERFGFSEEDAVKAVKIYRDRYAEKGIYEFKFYDGIKEVLTNLKERGYKTAIATLKAERFAKIMVEEKGFADLFDVVHGVDEQDILTKSDLIDMCINETNTEKVDSIMVGDSKNDAVGAQKSGIDFLALTYGFGLKTIEELNEANAKFIVASPLEILEKI